MLQLIVMGVSGCGKSTLARDIARQYLVDFIEGDDLHGPANIAKMRAGIALNDDDRFPWLDRVAATLVACPSGAVAACSSLRRIYRDRMRNAVGPNLRFLFLDLQPDLILARLNDRPEHFMAPTLLASQFETLERPAHEADVFTIVDADLIVDAPHSPLGAWLAPYSRAPHKPI